MDEVNLELGATKTKIIHKGFLFMLSFVSDLHLLTRYKMFGYMNPPLYFDLSGLVLKSSCKVEKTRESCTFGKSSSC